jgi:hypothetical protein
MELLGARKTVDVKFGSTVLAKFPFTRKVVEEDWIKKPYRKQKGMDGVELRRARVLAYIGGEKRVETSVDSYPPTQEIYKVPSGFDVNELPPLGEDMKKDDDPGTKPPANTEDTQRG